MPNKRQRGRGGDPGLKPTLRVLFPLARSYHLTFPQHPRTATPAGVQTSKRQSSCAISWSIICWILGPLSLTTHSVVLRPVVLATLRTNRIFYTQGWHDSPHLKQNPKWIICTSSLTSTAVVVQIRAVPTSSGIWILGPLLMVPFGGGYGSFRCCILAEQRRSLGTGLQTSESHHTSGPLSLLLRG